MPEETQGESEQVGGNLSRRWGACILSGGGAMLASLGTREEVLILPKFSPYRTVNTPRLGLFSWNLTLNLQSELWWQDVENYVLMSFVVFVTYIFDDGVTWLVSPTFTRTFPSSLRMKTSLDAWEDAAVLRCEQICVNVGDTVWQSAGRLFAWCV